MVSSIMKASAEVELGRRHPYLIRYGPKLAGAVAVMALVAGACWATLKGLAAVSSRPAPALPHVSVPTPSLTLVLVVVGVLVLAGAAVAYWRSDYRVGWRLYL